MHNLRDLKESIKNSNIPVIGDPEGWGRVNGKVSEEVVAKNFHKSVSKRYKFINQDLDGLPDILTETNKQTGIYLNSKGKARNTL